MSNTLDALEAFKDALVNDARAKSNGYVNGDMFYDNTLAILGREPSSAEWQHFKNVRILHREVDHKDGWEKL